MAENPRGTLHLRTPERSVLARDTDTKPAEGTASQDPTIRDQPVNPESAPKSRFVKAGE
jgi:hypothetical protein